MIIIVEGVHKMDKEEISEVTKVGEMVNQVEVSAPGQGRRPS